MSTWNPDAIQIQDTVEDEEFVDQMDGALASPREVPAWALSLGVHVLLLLVLGSITHITIVEEDTALSSVLDEEIDPETYKFDTTVVDQVGSDSKINSLSPSQAAATQAGQDPQKDLEEQLEDDLLTEIPLTDKIEQVNEAELVEKIDTTGATEHTGGVEGAVDRLALEIGGLLRERKLVVAWLFDASLSLKERRNAIADRFSNVYEQLGILNVDTDKALKTSVASFGKGLNIMTKEPVDDVREVVEMVRSIPPDESGEEHVFSAVRAVANQMKRYRVGGAATRRNVALIIVTDERGDDYALLEETIHFCKKYGIRVYCVGNAAVFGREKGFVEWTYSDGSKEDLPVDQGPETVAPERLQLAFWGSSNRGLDRMSSGFGPYALSRLCAETGGLYLVAAEGSGPRFDPVIMKNYLPDYRPIAEYHKQLKTNAAKGALVAAAVQTRAEKMQSPQLAFQANNDNVLRQEIIEAQKPAAVFDYKLQQMLTVLEQGEKDRAKLEDARWQASFDLAMGRVCAMRARAFGYNTVLAGMKAEPKSFQKKDNNQWKLVPSREIAGGPSVKKLVKKAREYLTRVIDAHPNTPWAYLAERELRQPMGWDWEEGRMNIASMGRGNGNDPNKPRLLLAEEEKKRKEAMRRKKMRAAEKPKL